MSEQITTILKRKLDDLSAYGNIDAETRRNALKEELQFYVLNFNYHHPEYNKWIMYGGSALRIIHGLDRMSVDLDFEVSHVVTEKFLEELKNEVEGYFVNTYGADSDFLTIKITTGRGLLLKFHVGKELSLGNPSNQVHVKIDLNHFVAPKTVTECRPINRDQLSFVILTYNMGALMASKLAAIFLRGTRGVGDVVYEEKGRDIYDLLWYMGKKIVPDLDYLIAKGVDVKNPRVLFGRLTMQMNKVDSRNLKNDLSPLFTNQTFIKNWLGNWRETYSKLLEDYKIRTVTALQAIIVSEDFHTDNFSFVYAYETKEKYVVKISYLVSYEWITAAKPWKGEIDEKLVSLTSFKLEREPNEQCRRFISLFYQKTENYFEKTNRIIMGGSIITKIIRMTADNLNPKEQIVLDISTLLSCDLDDLLK